MSTKKIGLVTFHNVFNYGGVLQAYALCEVLNFEDIECIDYIQSDLKAKYSHRIYDFKKSLKFNLTHFIKHYLLKVGVQKELKIAKFIKEYIPLSKESWYNLEDAKKYGNQYDVLISGSDQVWNPMFTGNTLDPVYILEFGKKSAKRISYASSAGAYKFNSVDRETIKKGLLSYDTISVREEYLKLQLNPILEKNIEVVLDPTLLLTASDWIKVGEPVEDLPTKYVLLYTFDNDLTCINLARKMADKLECKLVFISNQIKNSSLIDIALNNVGPKEFVWLFQNANFVVTNSFHGTTFSLIFRKNFYSIYKESNPYRVVNLLNRIELSDRLVKANQTINFDDFAISYEVANEKLVELVNYSKSFIVNSI